MKYQLEVVRIRVFELMSKYWSYGIVILSLIYGIITKIGTISSNRSHKSPKGQSKRWRCMVKHWCFAMSRDDKLNSCTFSPDFTAKVVDCPIVFTCTTSPSFQKPFKQRSILFPTLTLLLTLLFSSCCLNYQSLVRQRFASSSGAASSILAISFSMNLDYLKCQQLVGSRQREHMLLCFSDYSMQGRQKVCPQWVSTGRIIIYRQMGQFNLYRITIDWS